MRMRLTGVCALILAGALAGPALAGPTGLVLTGYGRFALFADLATIRRDGDIADMRAFQVADADFAVGGVAYWGGWSWWRFDCAGGTADRMDFASVRDGGVEGPSTPDRQGPYPAAPGGDAAELMAVACAPVPPPADVATLEQAVAFGRARLAE